MSSFRSVVMGVLCTLCVSAEVNAEPVCRSRIDGNGYANVECKPTSGQYRIAHDGGQGAIVWFLMQQTGILNQAVSEIGTGNSLLTEISRNSVTMNVAISELAKEIRVMNNNNLIAIRDQLITRISAMPITIVDDPAVVSQIKAMIAEEVEAAFELRGE